MTSRPLACLAVPAVPATSLTMTEAVVVPVPVALVPEMAAFPECGGIRLRASSPVILSRGLELSDAQKEKIQELIDNQEGPEEGQSRQERPSIPNGKTEGNS